MLWRRAIAVTALVVLSIETMHGRVRAQEPEQTQGGTRSRVPPNASSAREVGPQTPQPGSADGTGNLQLGGKRRPLYRLTKSDVVEVSFTFTPEFNQTVTVQPDGRISLRGTRAVIAEGMTAQELEETIRAAYAGLLDVKKILKGKDLNEDLTLAGMWRSEAGVATLPWMRRRLGELRAEFDYAVIHAAPAGGIGGTEMLARLTDGLVLVLEAHRTRKVLARVMQQKLQAAHVPVLGAVLSGRTFPIPERLYRRV